MSNINVNFKIIEIHPDKGAILVEYLADGATKEKFGADAGPYQINIPDNFATMSEDEIKNHIATVGVGIVQRQIAILESQAASKFDILNNLQDQIFTTTVDTSTKQVVPQVIEV